MYTFSYCEVMFFTKCVSQIGNECYFCSTCGNKTRSELTDSVPLQLQDSICEKDIFWNYFQAGYYCYEVIVMFLRLYHNIIISKRTLERRIFLLRFSKKGVFWCYNQRVEKRYRIWDTGTCINAWLSWVVVFIKNKLWNNSSIRYCN